MNVDIGFQETESVMEANFEEEHTQTPVNFGEVIVIERGGVTEEEIVAAVAKYFEENEVPSAKTSKISNVTLFADAWVVTETKDKYLQVVAISGVTENSQVDLKLSDEQAVIFREKDISFVTENDGGVVTVYAYGQMPQNNYTMQVTITEVDYE